MAKKKKPKVKPVDDDEVVPVSKARRGPYDDAEDDTDSSKPKARKDVYFGLTLLTTLILIGAAALLYMDQEDLQSSANAGFNPPSVSAGALGVRAAATN